MSTLDRSSLGFGIGRPLRLVLATLVLVLACPGLASAATAAPMCNELGQSIEAPPVVWGFDGGTISESPRCFVLGVGAIKSGMPAELGELVPLGPIKSLAVGAERLPRSPFVSRLALSREAEGARAGHRRDVYRPPR